MSNYSVLRVRVEGLAGYPDDEAEEDRFKRNLFAVDDPDDTPMGIGEIFGDYFINGTEEEFFLYTPEYGWQYHCHSLERLSADYPLLVFSCTWFGDAGCGRVDMIYHRGEATIKTIGEFPEHACFD